MVTIEEFFERGIDKLDIYKDQGIPDTKTLSDAIEYLNWYNSSSVIITNQSTVVGIFTEKDVVNKVFGLQKRIDNTALDKPIAEYMTKNPACLKIDDKIGRAYYLMYTKGFRHIPVVDNTNRPIGVLTIKNLHDYLAKNITDSIKSYYSKD